MRKQSNWREYRRELQTGSNIQKTWLVSRAVRTGIFNWRRRKPERKHDDSFLIRKRLPGRESTVLFPYSTWDRKKSAELWSRDYSGKLPTWKSWSCCLRKPWNLHHLKLLRAGYRAVCWERARGQCKWSLEWPPSLPATSQSFFLKGDAFAEHSWKCWSAFHYQWL